MTTDIVDPLEPLGRVARDGADRAARGLAGLGLADTHIRVPSVRRGLERDVYEAAGGAEAMVLGASLAVEGDEGGHALLLFPERRGLACVDMLCGRKPGATRELDPFGGSALLELGNVVCSAFINAMADEARLVLQPRPPVLIHETTQAALDIVQPHGIRAHDEMVLIDTVFADRRGAPSGLLVFVPQPSSIERVLERLG